MINVYVASKACHGPMWVSVKPMLANTGIRVIASWINESFPGQTVDMTDLWDRCIAEAALADVVLAYHKPGEEWKGAFVEIGAALSHKRPVYLVGDPPGSWTNHRLVRRYASLGQATAAIREYNRCR